MAEEPISQANLLVAYQNCLVECQQYKHQVGRLEAEAQQWVTHCLIVEATSRKNIVELEKANGDLARQLAQAKDGKQQLQGQVAAVKEELKLMDSAYQAAQAKVLSLKAEKAKLLEDLQAHSGKYQQAISDLVWEVTEAKEAKQQLQGDLAALNKELKVKHIANEAAQAEILRLKAEKVQVLDDLQAQSHKYQQDLLHQKSINAELTSLVTRLQQKNEEDKRALEELAKIKAENSRLNTDNSRLQTDNLRRLLDLGAHKSKIVEYGKLMNVQKAELAARQAELEALAFCKVDLSRMRARVLNLHKQKEQWKADERYMLSLNQQLRGAVTQLHGQLQELQQKTSIMEQHTAVVEADRQLQAHNLRLQRDLVAQRAKVAEYGKAAVGQKDINRELTRLVTESQQKIQQQENELDELAIVKYDLMVMANKLTKSKKLNESLKTKQQQLHRSNQQLQEVVSQLEHQLQKNTSTMVQHTIPPGDVVAAAQAALKPVAVGSSNAGRESNPDEPNTPELGDVNGSSS